MSVDFDTVFCGNYRHIAIKEDFFESFCGKSINIQTCNVFANNLKEATGKEVGFVVEKIFFWGGINAFFA